MEKKINRGVIRTGETDIKVHLIDSFPNHPYHVFDDEDMTELAASIEANGLLTVTVEADKEVVAEMHNEKKPEPEHPDSPQTGDNSNIGLWIFLMLASATALVVLLFVSKRKEVQ